jgi:uncharacterized glyoxalase superfamily protein PhnB
MAVNPIPEGYHSVTPYLIVEGAAQALEFAKQAFGATERMRMDTPEGKIGHAEITIGDSTVMIADAPTSDQGAHMPGVLHVYVDDADKTYRQALEAGGTSLREPQDQFYGDRMAGVKDSSGNHWWIATHVEDVSPEEMQRRAEEFNAQQS